MSVPTYTELFKLALDRAGLGDPSQTDQPVTDTIFARFINDALRDVWEASGGRLKSVASAVAWDSAQLATGVIYGLLTDVARIENLYATTTAPRSIVCGSTTASTAVSSATLFGDAGAGLTPVVPGMAVSHATAIVAGTQVSSVASTSALTLTQNAVIATTPSLTFAPTVSTNRLDEVSLAEIRQRRVGAGAPTYITPKIFAVERIDSNSVVANANLLRLEYWPALSGYYFPMEYVPQWVAIDASSNTTPALNDIEATDGGLIASARLAQAFDRTDRVPGILADISVRTQSSMERKLKAMLDAGQTA